MSNNLIKKALLEMSNTSQWEMQLVRINSNKDSISYYCRQVELTPSGNIERFVKELTKKYLSEKEATKYSVVDEYQGDVVANVVYKLDVSSELIKKPYIYRRKACKT